VTEVKEDVYKKGKHDLTDSFHDTRISTLW